MNLTDRPSPPNRARTWLAVGAILTLLWIPVARAFVVPMLWGQYATVFADAGPLLLSRGGFLMAFVVMPILVIVLPAAYATGQREWLAEQLAGAVMVGVGILAYGAYLHNIVHIRGVDASLAHIAAEVGFESVDAVPPHVKRALVLSDRLAAENKEPWLPGAWARVDWPAVPQPDVASAGGR